MSTHILTTPNGVSTYKRNALPHKATQSISSIQFFIHSRSTTRGIIQIIACMKIHHGGHIVQLLDSIYIMYNHKSLLSGGAQQILFTLHS